MVQPFHFPVMQSEVLEYLCPQDGQVIVDGTFGAGGYTSRFLEAGATVYAIDRDPEAISRGQELKSCYGERLKLLLGEFGDVQRLLASHGIFQVDGIVLDLGVSSPQLDQAHRGFSFQTDGPLDMRMSGQGVCAADVIATSSEEQLSDIFWRYGEERRSRAIAKAIVKMREKMPIDRTQVLADLVRRIVGNSGHVDGATRTFMALRIYVNDELGELSRALESAGHLLKVGGRMVVVSFHSLEDRLVKESFLGGARGSSRYLPQVKQKINGWKSLTSKPVRASENEIKLNQRSRSAKLRAAVWQGTEGESA